MTEPLSSFGLTSVSVAELGAFIQTQFNHQVSALELMTTATALSLAQTIVEGSASDGEAEVEAEDDGSAAVSERSHRRARRRSSPFANRFEDHFLNGGAAPADAFDAPGPRSIPTVAPTAVSAGD